MYDMYQYLCTIRKEFRIIGRSKQNCNKKSKKRIDAIDLFVNELNMNLSIWTGLASVAFISRITKCLIIPTNIDAR